MSIPDPAKNTNACEPLPTSAPANPLDETLIDYNLSLTPEERLLNHQRALDTINELMNAGKQIYGESQSPSKTSA